jgi:hypothetical protein
VHGARGVPVQAEGVDVRLDHSAVHGDDLARASETQSAVDDGVRVGEQSAGFAAGYESAGGRIATVRESLTDRTQARV